MKFIVAVLLWVVLTSPFAHAEDVPQVQPPTIVFHCMIENNTMFELERAANNDTWTLNVTVPSFPTQSATRPGTAMAYGEQHHKAEGVTSVEVYFDTGTAFYTFGRRDKEGKITGYVQVQRDGKETYGDCLEESFFGNFQIPNLFDNFNYVD